MQIRDVKVDLLGNVFIFFLLVFCLSNSKFSVVHKGRYRAAKAAKKLAFTLFLDEMNNLKCSWCGQSCGNPIIRQSDNLVVI